MSIYQEVAPDLVTPPTKEKITLTQSTQSQQTKEEQHETSPWWQVTNYGNLPEHHGQEHSSAYTNIFLCSCPCLSRLLFPDLTQTPVMFVHRYPSSNPTNASQIRPPNAMRRLIIQNHHARVLRAHCASKHADKLEKSDKKRGKKTQREEERSASLLTPAAPPPDPFRPPSVPSSH